MDNENKELLDEISKWLPLIQIDNDLIEYAFLKIYIKFEKLLVSLIKLYATGNSSIQGYSPNRRLTFQDEIHFKKTLKINFLSIDEDIIRVISSVFESNNPFTFFLDSSDQEFFNKMKIIRNFLAHESIESKEKYLRNVLFSEIFIEPKVYLLRNVSKDIKHSNFSNFISIISAYSDFFIKGSP